MTSEPMETTELVFTLHRGSDLKKSKARKMLKKVKRPYALVYIEGYPVKLRTRTDETNDSNPVWESHFKFKFQTPVPENKKVVFEIQHDSSTVDTSMGKVRIPLRDLLSGNGEEVSYAVHLSEVLVQGEIIISHKSNIIEPGGNGEALPAIEILSHPPSPPPGPSRGTWGAIKSFAKCFMLLNGIAEFIYEFN